MNELKASITILVSFIIAVLGLGNIEQFQESILDFSPIFFVLVAVVVFSELILINMLIRMGVKINYYAIIGIWVIVYILIWGVYLKDSKPIEVHLIQILLIVLSSLLAFDVGRRVGELDKTLEGLSSSAYPNRARDIQSSQDLITSEITRSRRYHHPLSILTVRLEKPKSKAGWKDLESLADDMFERFAVAKASKILSDLARSTDLVLFDRDGQFVLLCPETNLINIKILAERLEVAVEDGLHTKINWGIASFPDEALTFDDLLQTAQKRISQPSQIKVTEESV